MATVQMPTSVRVGAHVYSILRKPGSIMGDDLGHTDSSTLEIWIRARLKISKAKEILIHELLHAITLQALSCDKKYTDEDFIVVVAPLLLQVLLDNPSLVSYLIS